LIHHGCTTHHLLTLHNRPQYLIIFLSSKHHIFLAHFLNNYCIGQNFYLNLIVSSFLDDHKSIVQSTEYFDIDFSNLLEKFVSQVDLSITSGLRFVMF
jgi:hypothetical protein